jgi:dephospho-CoA kinase
MIVLGITGGIGSGKTTVANFFKKLGVPVFIADEQAKQLMNSSTELRQGIVQTFGEDAYQNNQLNREYLAKQVFNDSEALQKLNQLVHPIVAEAFRNWKNKQNLPLVAYEAAILFEHNRQEICDYTILVVAPIEVKIKRIQERDDASRSQIEARMKNQWSDERKMKLADFVIKNEELLKIEENIHKIYKYLKNTHNF